MQSLVCRAFGCRSFLGPRWICPSGGPSSPSSTEVSFPHCDNNRTLKCFFVDRTERDIAWPPFNTPIEFLWFVRLCGNCSLTICCSPALPVRLNTHVSMCICSVNMPVGANNRMWIPFGIVSSGNECRPDSLTFPTDWYLWVLSLSHLLLRLLSRFFVVSEGERDLLFPLPILFTSFLNLHESPREHCPFEIHGLQSPCFSIFGRFLFWWISLSGFVSKLMPLEETCLHCEHWN